MPARGVKYSDSEVPTLVQKRKNGFSSKKLRLITGCVKLSNSEKRFRIITGKTGLDLNRALTKVGSILDSIRTDCVIPLRLT